MKTALVLSLCIGPTSAQFCSSGLLIFYMSHLLLRTSNEAVVSPVLFLVLVVHFPSVIYTPKYKMNGANASETKQNFLYDSDNF